METGGRAAQMRLATADLVVRFEIRLIGRLAAGRRRFRVRER